VAATRVTEDWLEQLTTDHGQLTAFRSAFAREGLSFLKSKAETGD